MVMVKVYVFWNVMLCSLIFCSILLPPSSGCMMVATGYYALLIQFYQTIVTSQKTTFIFHTICTQPMLYIYLIHIQSNYQIQSTFV